MKLAEEFSIGGDFPAASYADWRSLVEADLAGVPFEKKLVTQTYEGIDIQPVYTRQDFDAAHDPFGFPGLPMFVRGAQSLGQVLTGTDLRQQYAEPEPTAANRAIREDLAGGVTSVELQLDAAAAQGFDPGDEKAAALAGQGGVMAYCVDDLDAALANVDLASVGVALVSGAAFVPAAAMFTELWRRRDVPLDQAHGAFNADPLTVLAREGKLPMSAEQALTALGDLAAWTSENLPRVTAVAVDTSAYHHAGATSAQDLAIALASATAYLRAMTAAGLSVDAAARQILFRISLGAHHFLAIAKLRAARRLWARVVEAAGGSDAAAAMQIHARVSDRVLTARDPYVNILRNTVGVFAAILGGAQVVTSVPLDQVVGPADNFTRRVARNTLLILEQEAQLHRVIDPAGGSWFLDRITTDLATEAWKIFQEIERRGGMLAVLESGWIASEIEAAFAPRAKDIARRKEGITGVSEFPNVAEEPIARKAPDVAALRRAAIERTAKKATSVPASIDNFAAALNAAANGATIGQLARALSYHQSQARVEPLPARSFAEPFEDLRDAADAWQTKHGTRPRVFLANLGPVAHHTVRATYSKNFFEAGGFEVLSSEGFRDAATAAAAFKNSGASVAVICSSDKLYPELVPPTAAALKQAGARSVVLAGNPGENEAAWRAAGVDRFIYIKCDVLATLREMLREEGVLAS
ncbi:MAG: methylmalonyl-CoA mutase family protein [Pirellulales bacterium]